MLLQANSKAEAEGLALQNIKKWKPMEEDWSNYDAVSTEVSKEGLLLRAKFARSESEIKK
jgi:hypothetical protein